MSLRKHMLLDAFIRALQFVFYACNYTVNEEDAISNVRVNNDTIAGELIEKEEAELVIGYPNQCYKTKEGDSIIGFYPHGTREFVQVENRTTGLVASTTYYENGKIKSEGMMATDQHVSVGTLRYFNSFGELDSTVNHDKKYKISYFEGLVIAEKYGINCKPLLVSLVETKA